MKSGCIDGRYLYCLADESNVMVLQSTTGEGPSSDSGVESTGDGSRTGTPTSFANNYTGILTLVNQQRVRWLQYCSFWSLCHQTSLFISNVSFLSTLVLRVVALCVLLGRYQCFGRTYCVNVQGLTYVFKEAIDIQMNWPFWYFNVNEYFITEGIMIWILCNEHSQPHWWWCYFLV
jgi:hypothetical protein